MSLRAMTSRGPDHQDQCDTIGDAGAIGQPGARSSASAVSIAGGSPAVGCQNDAELRRAQDSREGRPDMPANSTARLQEGARSRNPLTVRWREGRAGALARKP